jgi:hypothetical protein
MEASTPCPQVGDTALILPWTVFLRRNDRAKNTTTCLAVFDAYLTRTSPNLPVSIRSLPLAPEPCRQTEVIRRTITVVTDFLQWRQYPLQAVFWVYISSSPARFLPFSFPLHRRLLVSEYRSCSLHNNTTTSHLFTPQCLAEPARTVSRFFFLASFSFKLWNYGPRAVVQPWSDA